MVELDNSVQQPGRRRKRAELKELVLEAGFQVLVREGLDIGVDHVNYTKVFEHLEATKGVRVTRGSVHERIWDSQRDFQLDLVKRAAEWVHHNSTEAVIDASADVVAAADFTTHAGRDRAIGELCRVLGRVNIEMSEQDDLWYLWQGVVSAFSVTRNREEEVEAVRTSVLATYASISERLEGFYRLMMDTVGLEPRADLFASADDAITEFTMQATAMADGWSLRRRFQPEEARLFMLPTGPDGELQEWDHFSFGVVSLIRGFFVNPPD